MTKTLRHLSRGAANFYGRLQDQNSFEKYVIYCSLVISSSLVFGYDWLSKDGLRYSFWSLATPLWSSDVFNVPTFQNGVLKIWDPGPSHLVAVQILSSFALMARPIRRMAAAVFFFSTLYSLNYYECISVLTNYYLVFALGLMLFSTDNPAAQRGFILGGLATGWLSSSLQKIDSGPLDGAEVMLHLRLIARPYFTLMSNPNWALGIFLIGSVLEMLSGFIFFAGRRLAALGFFSALAFSVGIFVSINGGSGVLKFFIGLCFLIGFRWADARVLILLLIGPFVAEALLRLPGLLLPAPFSLTVTEALLFIYALSFLLLFGWLCFKSHHGMRSASLPPQGRRARLIAVGVCASYALIARLMYLPMPLGWTQYAGYKESLPAKVVFVSGRGARPLEQYFSFFIFWDLRGVVTSDESLILGAVIDGPLMPSVLSLCGKGIEGLRYAEEQIAWKDFMRISYDRQAVIAWEQLERPKLMPVPCSAH